MSLPLIANVKYLIYPTEFIFSGLDGFSYKEECYNLYSSFIRYYNNKQRYLICG